MTIEITQNSSGNISIFGRAKIDAAIHLVREAVEDIGDEIEDVAKTEAPLGETGALRLHPVERSEIGIGTIEAATGRARHPAGSPGGIGGRFAFGGPTGETIVRQKITLPEEPKYAKWVHDGTGIYGPRGEAIRPHTKQFLVFFFDKALGSGDKFFGKEVKGQQKNPYLERTFVIISGEYVPIRIERLRAEIKAL
jgi:hypothetical protein